MDDTWEDDATPSTGFGGGFGRGFGGAGRGAGGGFGSMNGDSDRKPGQGRGRGSSGGGFGGGGQKMSNGFGSSSTATNEDWGDAGGFGTGGGSSTGFGGGGFGSSSGQSSGFGSERKGGSGGGGGGGCYKCGQDGHFARECPNSEGGGGGGFGAKKSGSGCFKCGEEGHFSRECPSSGGGGGGFGGGERKKGCFKCGEEGHMARDCPSAEGGGGGFGGDRKRGCFKCGEEGHMSRECPTGGGGGGSRSGGFGSSDGGDKKTGCFKCGEEGHFSRECPTAGEGEGPRTERYVPPPPPEDEENIFHADVVKGINFDKYDDIQVECTGEGSTKTGISSFMQCDLHPSVEENVRKAKYDKPTPVQKFAIPFTLKERDIMACAQTGSGKTAAFLVPIISSMLKEGIDGSQFSEVQAPRCVIVGPTRELVLQIRDQARKFSYGTMLRPVVVYGGTSVQSQLSDVFRGTHILIGTPGRLLDFIEKGKVSLARVKYLVLDEADRMLDMGFSPSIRKLVRDLGMPSKMERQTLMFSATFPEEIQKLAREFLNNYIFITVGRVGGANEDICQTIYRVSRTDKREKLVSILNDQGSVDRVLIFVEQKRQADFLASYLSQSGYTCTSIHGDRLQREREEALRDFKRAVAPVLVATSVAARGLDISDVKHVVNFDLPSAIEDYVHRIGRTGRCGNMGKATSFYDPDDNKDLARPLVKILQDAHQEVPDWLEEDAEHQLGTGFSGLGGKYGGKDARAGKFGGGGDDAWDTGASNSGGGFGGGGAADDESWD